MSDHPIIFQGWGVRAIINGTKTHTRRVVKTRPENNTRVGPRGHQAHIASPEALDHCPYGNPGDLLWVRETWGYYGGDEYLYQQEPRAVAYRATNDVSYVPGGRWRPSIHMPRWASRLTLRVSAVRVERLTHITNADARAEGFEAAEEFLTYWDILNAKRGYLWESNPWVWVIVWDHVYQQNIDEVVVGSP